MYKFWFKSLLASLLFVLLWTQTFADQQKCTYENIVNNYDYIYWLQLSEDFSKFSFTAKKDGKTLFIKDWDDITWNYNYVSWFKYNWDLNINKEGKIYWFEETEDSSVYVFLMKSDNKYTILQDLDWLDSQIDIKTISWLKYYPKSKKFIFNKNENGKKTLIKKICRTIKSSYVDKSNDIKSTTFKLRDKKDLFKDHATVSQKLKKSKESNKYLVSIDKVVKNMSDKKLVQMHERLDKIDTILLKDIYKDVINYFKIKIWLEIHNREYTSSLLPSFIQNSISHYLHKCSKSEVAFNHIFTWENMTRSVLGIQNWLCVYEETIPNDWKMVCRYNQPERNKLAVYYYNNENNIENKEIEKEATDIVNNSCKFVFKR